MDKTTRKDIIKAKATKATKATKVDATKDVATPVPDYTFSVADVARSLNLNPKVARAKLRRKGMRAIEGRHTRVVPNSPEHAALVALLTPRVVSNA